MQKPEFKSKKPAEKETDKVEKDTVSNFTFSCNVWLL